MPSGARLGREPLWLITRIHFRLVVLIKNHQDPCFRPYTSFYFYLLTVGSIVIVWTLHLERIPIVIGAIYYRIIFYSNFQFKATKKQHEANILKKKE